MEIPRSKPHLVAAVTPDKNEKTERRAVSRAQTKGQTTMKTIKAFTVHKVRDEHHTYWVVPLHDCLAIDAQNVMVQLFHSQKDAEQFAAEHRDQKPAKYDFNNAGKQPTWK